jgi:hypothetical protein
VSRTVAGTKAGDAPRRVPALAYLVIWGEALEAAAGGALAKQGLEGFCRRRRGGTGPRRRKTETRWEDDRCLAASLRWRLER